MRRTRGIGGDNVDDDGDDDGGGDGDAGGGWIAVVVVVVASWLGCCSKRLEDVCDDEDVVDVAVAATHAEHGRAEDASCSLPARCEVL